MEQGIEGRQRFGQAGVGSAHLERQTSRNMCVGRKTIFGTSQVDLGRVPVSVRSLWIATNDAMHAEGVDSSRLRYDDCR